MAELGYLDNHRLFKVEDVLRAEQVELASPLAKLPVVKGIVVCLPCDQRDIEITRNAEPGTEHLEVGSFDWRGFGARPNSIEAFSELTEAMVDLSRFVNPLSNVDRERDYNAARQRCFPTDQTPCLIAVLIFPALNEGRLNTDLGAQQVFPLVPGGVPRQRQCGLVEHDFQPPASVSVDCAIIVEGALPQGHLHALHPPFG